jgi:MoaA/NifB/PqqE/SkfB family radical SAM enzyme
MNPWHWLLITQDGDVRPCSHGSAPIGNLANNTIAEIWNGRPMQDLRSAILAGKVPPGCCPSGCPFQQSQVAFTEPMQAAYPSEEFVFGFDEKYYLEKHSDVRHAVKTKQLVSGLEHYLRHGNHERRAHRINTGFRHKLARRFRGYWARYLHDWNLLVPGRTRRNRNAILAIYEYCRGASVSRATPVDIVLSLTTACNLKCVMCPQGKGLITKPQHMPVTYVKGMRHYLKAASRICLSGVGEQTIAHGFYEILRTAPRGFDRSLKLNSNGHSLTDKRIQKLLNSGVTEISFSLDAATTATYMKIRGGDFNKVLTGISNLVAARRQGSSSNLEICINMTLSCENLSEAADFVELGKLLRVDVVVFSQLYSFGDTPGWSVTKGDWTFVYSEQMISRCPEEAQLNLNKAKAVSERVSMPIEFQSNVASYLTLPANIQNEPVKR